MLLSLSMISKILLQTFVLLSIDKLQSSALVTLKAKQIFSNATSIDDVSKDRYWESHKVYREFRRQLSVAFYV